MGGRLGWCWSGTHPLNEGIHASILEADRQPGVELSLIHAGDRDAFGISDQCKSTLQPALR